MKSKRIIASLLTVGMLLGLLPGAAFAEEGIPVVVEGLAVCETCGEDPCVCEGETAVCETCGEDPCVCEEEPSGEPETPETEEPEAPETEAPGTETEKPEEEGGEPEPQEPEADSSEEESMTALTLREEEPVETGYKEEALPEGPDMSGTVVNVTPENAQYTLDGAYGSIDGKTVHFTDGVYDALELGRTTKYAGSGTKYYKGGNTTNEEIGIDDVAGTGTRTYVRTMSDVTFTADSGAVLGGFYGATGHHYGDSYDYVRDTQTVSTNTSYYVWWTMENITFEGLTIEGKFDFACSGTQTDVDGITFRNCKFTGAGTESTVGAAIRMQTDLADCYRNITVDGCEFTNYFQGLFTQGLENVTVRDCKFTTMGHNAIALQNGASNTVRGTIEISGNIFTDGKDRAIRFGNIGENAEITVSGNTAVDFADSDGEVMKAGTVGGSASITVAEDNNWGDGHVHDALLPVAKIGNKSYPTLQAAIDAAKSGETVVMLKDAVENIQVSNRVVLDLNGKTLTNADEGSIGNEAMTIWVKAGGALEVVGEGTVKITKAAGAAVFNQGTVTLSGGTYERPAGTKGYVLFNSVGAEMILNEGVTAVSADPASSLAAFDAGKNGSRSTVTINGGTYTSINTTLKNDANTDLVINGGTFTTSTHYALVNYDKATVNGGKFHGRIWNSTGIAGVGELKVEGGNFDVAEDKDVIFVNNGEGTIAVSGGTFSRDVSEYCVEGMQWDEETGGIVAKVEENTVAVVGDVAYESLEAAVAAAPAGGSVQVLRDVTLTESINPGKEITIEGINKEDGSKPVISGAKGLFSFTKASGTLKNLELQATGNTWYIYHSAGVQTGEVKLTVSGCEFTMAEGVTAVGNLVMTEGTKTKTQVIFTGNTVKAHSRVAFAGPGDNTVITDNVIDLMGEQYATGGRTSVIGLTATAETGNVVITGNVFQNANRVLAVDNAPNMPADKLIFQNNKFIDCRWALELKGNDEREFNINYNYFSFGGQVSEPRVEDADGSAGHFDDGNAYVGEGVVNDVYYTTEAMERILNLTPATVSIRVGNTAALTATSETMDGTVTWTSSNPAVASVSESGVVTAVAAGSAVITAAMGDTTAACTVTVTQTTSGGGSSSGGGSTARPALPVEELDESAVPLAQPLPFTDVAETDWFHDAVRFVFDRDMMKGTGDGTVFQPGMTTTRGMIVTILYRLEGEPEAAGSAFTDVAEGAWYAAAVNWAAANGVVKGYEDGSFRPEGIITREETAVILGRYATLKGYDKTAQGNMELYNDKTLISDWAREDMTWAVGAGLLKGKESGLLDPRGNTSRAEAAQVLMNFCEGFEKK